MKTSIVETKSVDAFTDWEADIARFDDLRDSLTPARALGRVAGAKLEIADRHPGASADEQRSEMASAVAGALARYPTDAEPAMMIFDRDWHAATPVHRRLAVDRLIDRAARRFGSQGAIIDATLIDADPGLRASVILSVEPPELASALAAVEQDQGALVASTRSVDSAATLFNDLFRDVHGELATRPAWPLWVARRCRAGDIVVLADELNDHTGRRALVLWSGSRSSSGSDRA